MNAAVGQPKAVSSKAAERIELQGWQCWLLVIAVVAFGIGGMLGAAGELGEEIALTLVVIVFGSALVELLRRAVVFVRAGGARRLIQEVIAPPLPALQAAVTDTQGEQLAEALSCAQRAEEEATARYQYAGCASEEVLRARAIRVQAEIALMRHRMHQLQHAYRVP